MKISDDVFVCPGAQSDSELSPHHPSEVNVDRGYTSDSEVYTEHSKTRIPRSTTDVDVASSGWLVVSTHMPTHKHVLTYHMLSMTSNHCDKNTFFELMGVLAPCSAVTQEVSTSSAASL